MAMSVNELVLSKLTCVSGVGGIFFPLILLVLRQFFPCAQTYCLFFTIVIKAISKNTFAFKFEHGNQSGIVISFDNHVTSQHGGHIKNREFWYSLIHLCTKQPRFIMQINQQLQLKLKEIHFTFNCLYGEKFIANRSSLK